MRDGADWAAHFDDHELAALDLADAMSGGRSHDLETDLITRLQQQFTELELAELILVAGQANLNNRAGNAAKQLLGPDPASARGLRTRRSGPG